MLSATPGETNANGLPFDAVATCPVAALVSFTEDANEEGPLERTTPTAGNGVEDVIVEAVAAIGICPAVMPDMTLEVRQVGQEIAPAPEMEIGEVPLKPELPTLPIGNCPVTSVPRFTADHEGLPEAFPCRTVVVVP